MHRLWLSTTILIIALILTACGAAPTAESPTPASVPTERPTSTPRPTQKPQPTKEPEPTEEPQPTDEPQPTEDSTPSTDFKTQPVDMGDLTTYKYTTELFSIDVPSSWSSDDRSTSDEVLVRFTDKTENGVILVDLFEMADTQTEEQLTKLLTDYLTNTYSKQDGFSQDAPKKQTDGSVLVVWGYDATVSTGEKVRLLGNSFIEQRENKVSILTTAVPDEQFDTLSSAINKVINSYKFDASVAVSSTGTTSPTTTGTQTQEIAIGDLETYNYDTGLFSIDVPKEWTLKDNSKPGEAIVLWSDKTENGLIVVDLFENKDQQTQDQLITFLQDFLNKSFKSEKDFQLEDPKPQSDGSVLIVWSYTATATGGVETKLLGNSFIEQKQDKVSILTTAVPDEQFDALLPSTNKIINSYKIDPASALP